MMHATFAHADNENGITGHGEEGIGGLLDEWINGTTMAAKDRAMVCRSFCFSL
jgi:hypothetical protein